MDVRWSSLCRHLPGIFVLCTPSRTSCRWYVHLDINCVMVLIVHRCGSRRGRGIHHAAPQSNSTRSSHVRCRTPRFPRCNSLGDGIRQVRRGARYVSRQLTIPYAQFLRQRLGYKRLALGVAPALYAWPTLALAPEMALAAQWAGFTAFVS